MEKDKFALSDTVASSETHSDLSEEIKRKIEWFGYYQNHGKNARLTCRYFGISPDTFYRWKKRYNPNDLISLVDDKKTRRTKKLKEPTTPLSVVNRIRELKAKYPAWGRNKLSILLQTEGVCIGVSTIGRIISRLRKVGLLYEPVTKTKDKEIPIRQGHRLPTGYVEDRKSVV